MNQQLFGVAHQLGRVTVTATPPTKAKWNRFLPSLAHSVQDISFYYGKAYVRSPLTED